jgi:hypothetical protein
MTLAYGLTTGHRYLGSQLEDPIAVLDCVLTEWYLSERIFFTVVISTEYGVVGGHIRGTTAYGLKTGYRYLGSQLEDPIAVLDTVLTDWYLAGWDSIYTISGGSILDEYGIVGGTIPGNLTLEAPLVSDEYGINSGTMADFDQTHAFGLKTGWRYMGSLLEDPIAVLDIVLTDWYLRRWDSTQYAAIVSTEYQVAVSPVNILAIGAVISTEFAAVGGSFNEGIKIQGAVISTMYEVRGFELIPDPILLSGSSSEIRNLAGSSSEIENIIGGL